MKYTGLLLIACTVLTSQLLAVSARYSGSTWVGGIGWSSSSKRNNDDDGSTISKVAAIRGGETPSRASQDQEAARVAAGALPQEEIEKTSFISLLGDKLLKVTDSKKGTTEEVDTKDALAGKYTAIYFGSKVVEDKLKEVSAGQSQSIVSPTPVLKKVYDQCKEEGRNVEMVFVPVSDTEEAFKEHFKDMPWLAIKPDNKTVMNLMSKGGIQVLPTVVIVDDKGEIVTTDGYSNMVYFPEDFPWANKDLIQLLGDDFVKADGTKVAAEQLRGKVLGVYFSAEWCAPCKVFTPQLKEAYNKVKGMGKDFEIVFVSSDNSDEEFKSYLATMPWLAVPYEGKRKALISQLLGVRNLPTFLLFDENLKLITPNGRLEVMKDPECKEFPWHPKPLNELSSSPEVLAQGPVLLVFMEGADKKDQERITAVLQPVAEKRMADAEDPESSTRRVAFLTASEIDQLSGPMRKLCKLEEIQGKFKFMKSKKEVMKPKMVLLDLVKGQFSVSSAKDITTETVNEVLKGFDDATLTYEQFEVAAQGEGGAGAAGQEED